MKREPAALLLATALLPLQAGTPAPEPAETPAAAPWLKPTFNLRARFEYAEVGAPGLDPAHALAFRERIGLVTRDFLGLSAVVEGEFTQALVDAYDAAPTPFATQTVSPNPFFPRTQVNDPETRELNQAYLQFSGFDTTIRAGRQRIILNNAAMVGNVVWRQNEQTYDAVSITSTPVEDLTLFYAWANRANRIFGSDATGSLRSFAGDIHLFNAGYTGFGDLGLTGYALLMDFDETAANAGYISNNTFGIIATGPAGPLTLYGEIAWQTDTASSPAFKPDEAWYGHFTASCKLASHTLTLGFESLGADFVTPLATTHAFNGFADAFAAQRTGTVRSPGLNDVYLTHAVPLPFGGIGFSHSLHLFGDNDASFDFGWEYDAVLTRTFGSHLTAIAKFAWFDAAATPATSPAPFDTTRISVELDYQF